MEARLVALVETDDLPHVGIALRDPGCVLREELDAVRCVHEGARLQGVDREDHLEAAAHGLGNGSVEERLVDDRGRVRRVPEDRDPVLGHPEVGQHVEEVRAAVLGVLAGVVSDAERRARRRTCQRERRAGARQDRSDPPHSPLVGRSGCGVERSVGYYKRRQP